MADRQQEREDLISNKIIAEIKIKKLKEFRGELKEHFNSVEEELKKHENDPINYITQLQKGLNEAKFAQESLHEPIDLGALFYEYQQGNQEICDNILDEHKQKLLKQMQQIKNRGELVYLYGKILEEQANYDEEQYIERQQERELAKKQRKEQLDNENNNNNNNDEKEKDEKKDEKKMKKKNQLKKLGKKDLKNIKKNILNYGLLKQNKKLKFLKNILIQFLI
ncbi:hypothetical protein M0811_11395 [Anaeramoeba ignava]|uniref:Uncharacterized protein n=1 Tax=Anaeramoeba ignava TaxID=1746090 RepID=A0A9Q0LCQ6_ANAIG|nr:hypothetical protein M0811_11395 [Anaeramoeba ignava]